jgi:hypothetical protein
LWVDAWGWRREAMLRAKEVEGWCLYGGFVVKVNFGIVAGR